MTAKIDTLLRARVMQLHVGAEDRDGIRQNVERVRCA
jgi:hypothetical protein